MNGNRNTGQKSRTSQTDSERLVPVALIDPLIGRLLTKAALSRHKLLVGAWASDCNTNAQSIA